jgi:hypothetical protein
LKLKKLNAKNGNPNSHSLIKNSKEGAVQIKVETIMKILSQVQTRNFKLKFRKHSGDVSICEQCRVEILHEVLSFAC